MKNLKKFLAVLLTVAMLASVMLVPAFAEGEELTAVEQVGILGLLKGDGEGLTDEYLSQNLTRMQVAILYARLIGIEEDAYAFDAWDEDTNFADYDDDTSASEENMLAFFYDDSSYGFIGTDMDEDLGLMKFEPQSLATNKELVKILLTAMDYPYGDQYDWSDILSFARSVGIDLGTRETQINMNDVAEAMIMALESKMDDGTVFAQYLIDQGILDADAVAEAGINLTGEEEEESDEELPTLEVQSITASNFAEVELTFNQKVDADSLKREQVRVDNKKITSKDYIYVVEDYGDGKVVRIMLEDGFVSAQNETRTVTLTGVKTPKGTVMASFSQDVVFRDSSAPTIEKVVAKGNTRLDIYFSEPISDDSTSYLSASTYKINGKGISASKPEIDDYRRKITIKKLTNYLAPGEYELSIDGTSDQIMDYAGINAGYQVVKFTIIEDKEGPIAQEVLTPVYQNKVEIVFDEEITEDATIYWTDSNGKKRESDLADVDGDIATFKFSGTSNMLPFSATTIVLQDCKDYSGNAAQAPTSFTVTAVADNTRPEVVDYGSEEEGAIWVRFNKDVEDTKVSSSNYTFKDSDGDKVTDTITVGRDPDDDDDETILYFESTAFDADTYTITLKGVKDTSPQENELLSTTFDVTVPDTEEPEVLAAWWADYGTNTIIYVYFSEKVDSSTATTRANYEYNSSTSKYSTFPTNTRFDLQSGDRLVKITLKSAISPIPLNIKVSDVEDLEGNEMSTDTVLIGTDGDPYAPEVKLARATGTRTIKLNLTSSLTAYDVSDFELTDRNGSSLSKIGINSVKTEDSGTTVVITTDRDIEPNGNYNHTTEMYVKHTSLIKAADYAVDANRTDSSNNKIFCVNDRIGPKLLEMYEEEGAYDQTSSNALLLIFNEKVVPESGNWGDVLQLAYKGIQIESGSNAVGKNGSTLTWEINGDTTAYSDGTYAVIVKLTGGYWDGENVNIIYNASNGRLIKDQSGNNLTIANYNNGSSTIAITKNLTN